MFQLSPFDGYFECCAVFTAAIHFLLPLLCNFMAQSELRKMAFHYLRFTVIRCDLVFTNTAFILIATSLSGQECWFPGPCLSFDELLDE
jgi:hypothetical protein